jgi:hypothetical protein
VHQPAPPTVEMLLFTVLRENARLGACDAAASTLSVLNGCRRRRLRRSEFRRSRPVPKLLLKLQQDAVGKGLIISAPPNPFTNQRRPLFCASLSRTTLVKAPSRDSYAGERFLLPSSHLPSSHAARFTVCPDANRSAVTLVHDPSHQPECDSRWPVVIASSQCPGARARQPPEPPHAACMDKPPCSGNSDPPHWQEPSYSALTTAMALHSLVACTLHPPTVCCAGSSPCDDFGSMAKITLPCIGTSMTASLHKVHYA